MSTYHLGSLELQGIASRPCPPNREYATVQRPPLKHYAVPAVSHPIRPMSEPPPASATAPDASSDASSELSARSFLTGIAFFLVAGILAILGDLGLASLSALLGTGVVLLAAANEHRPHFARLGLERASFSSRRQMSIDRTLPVSELPAPLSAALLRLSTCYSAFSGPEVASRSPDRIANVVVTAQWSEGGSGAPHAMTVSSARM